MKYYLDLKNKKVIGFFVITLTCFLLILFRNLFTPLNLSVEKFFSKIKGETNPDTNIVLLHISSSDLESIGPWPIKRSYYALLINNLNRNKAKLIGLEIFLSAKFLSQTIYDNLLTKEIIKADRVVLSSVAGGIINSAGKYNSDSLSYPSPKLLSENIRTGHINYFDEQTLKIPLEINALGEKEYAFSYQFLDDDMKANLPQAIEINFISSWKKFKNYSLLEYYDFVQDDDENLKFFENKIIIIGVSDPQITRTIETTFDKEAPAFTLHAFALDNLMNKRYLRDEFKLLSTILFSGFFLIALWLTKKYDKKSFLIVSACFILLLVTAFTLYSLFYLHLDYLAIIFPFLFLLISDIVLAAFEKQVTLVQIIDEANALKGLLETKEAELKKVKQEFELSEQSKSKELIERIKTLETEISKLRFSNDDQSEDTGISNLDVKEFHSIIYKSNLMHEVIEIIKKTASEDAPILITGESGTGKELVAKAIHSLSRRNRNNFVAVNCGAISESLLESELFGHVKGAFTGALADKIGRFEAANNGTIFLDEIAETSENFQVKLLRVLQFGEFEKVGSSKTSKVDVRIIAATNKKLETAVREKKFREDLFYRLNVIRIDLPPLRERKEDIIPIANYFMSRETPNLKISKAVAEALIDNTWNGNVRELESVIKRAVIFAKSAGRNMIQLNDLPKEIVKHLKLDFEDLVLDSLKQKKFSHASIVETAKELGNISRTTVSENFRGLVLKTLVDNDFDEEKTAKEIAETDNDEILQRVKIKIRTFVRNIHDSLQGLDAADDFEAVKYKLSSKYKNLPQRFHPYLDEVIKNYLKK